MAQEGINKNLSASGVVDKNNLVFKPGDRSYTNFGREVLNRNVAWHEILQDIIDTGYNKAVLALEAGVQKSVLNRALSHDYDGIYFRAGARILTIHCRLYPHKYGF